MDEAKFSLLLPDKPEWPFEIIRFKGPDDADFKGSKDDFETTIRVNLNAYDEVKDWVRDFSKSMLCDFVSQSTGKRKKAKVYCRYTCSLSSTNKTRPLAKSSSCPDLTERNYGCTAAMSIWVYDSAAYSDKYMLKNLACEIELKWNHNHKLDTAHYMSLLRPLEETKEIFHGYFALGYFADSAILEHVSELKRSAVGNVAELLASKARNPSKNIIWHWYQQWRTDKFGKWKGSLEALTKKESIYSDQGIVIRLSSDPFAILIMTPMMLRAHQLESASKISFVDSTSTCDSVGHSVTFMLTETCIGAVPLAIFITPDQTEKAYFTAFKLLKDALKEKAFGGAGSPKIFMTDDSVAERKALSQVWPDATLHNCIFHIAQAQWRWLYEGKNQIDKDHRQVMMNDFRRIMFSTKENEAMEAYAQAISRIKSLSDAYSHCAKRLESYWARRVDWVIAYRNHNSRGNFTNNYAEITVRLFKDNVLHRHKSYNAASLVDSICSRMEEYYQARLLDFANCRDNSPFLQFEKLTLKASFVESKDAIVTCGDGIYLVPSEHNDTKYEVDTRLCHCACNAGHFGEFCKHAAAIMKFFEIALSHRPPVNGWHRHQMATLALGTESPPPSFFQALNEEIADDTSTVEMAVVEMDSSVEEMAVENDTSSVEMAAVQNVPSSSTQERIDPALVKKFMDAVTEDLLNNETNAVLLNAFKRISSKYFARCQRRPSNLAKLFSSATTSVKLRNRAGGKIPVQPTAKSRRKSLITKGTSSRLAAGRTPACLADKPKSGRAPQQKIRNLGRAICENRPNAKSHN